VGLRDNNCSFKTDVKKDYSEKFYDILKWNKWADHRKNNVNLDRKMLESV